MGRLERLVRAPPFGGESDQSEGQQRGGGGFGDDLELVVSGAGTGFCFGAFEGDCFKLPSSGEYSLKLALGPRPVPVLSGGALGILAGMLAILGAKRARGVA